MVLLYGILPPLMIMGLGQSPQQRVAIIPRVLHRLTTPGNLAPTLRLLGVLAQRPWLLGASQADNSQPSTTLTPVLAMLISFSVAIGGTHAIQDAKRITHRLSLSQLEALVGNGGDTTEGLTPAARVVMVSDDVRLQGRGGGTKVVDHM